MGFLSSLTGGGILDSVGGFLGASAQKKQTKKSIQDFNRADAAALAGRDATLGYYGDFLKGGTQGFNNALAMQTPGYDYKSLDPGYNYIQDQALRAVERGAAARGALRSGGTIKDELRQASGIAAQDFNNAFNRNTTLGQFGLQGANGSAAAQSGYVNALYRGAEGRVPVRRARGQAISDQWGAGTDFAKSVVGAFGGGGGGGWSGLDSSFGSGIDTGFSFSGF
jgi:hypothetical protein